ncbi:muconate/chloromuconate family cycloisomerase [Nocardioides donggukensis]|uniref:Chloromuconate cycloisomerase n=1 Tax=Nocardioides donggukensis TaxID=2774019 RepID=A0A927K5C6_9ACTN|nr:muconate/chloromuconate family cycloisomerase [Nocardioides donggukensis]MBD8868015.1 chloromuconate cycloisomerase [Nocardioides donggukensis]
MTASLRDDDLLIERVETVIIDVPLRRPHRFARVTMNAQPVLLVYVHTRGGVTGVGEGVVPGGPWWGGESVESMKVTIDTYLAPLIAGRRVDAIEALMCDMGDVVAVNLFAKTAVEVALHDAWARALDVPLHTLLGGLTRTSIDVTWALGAEPVEIVVEEIQRFLAAGSHRSFKLKMGAVDPADDVDRIAAIADKVGEAASLRVDLNARWDLLTSRRLLPRLAHAGIDLIEQPVPGEQIEALAELNALLPIPIMADESLRTPHDALRLVELRAADVWSMKVTKVGGLRRARDIVAIGAAAGVPVHGGTSLETGVGTAASLHLACAAPGVTWGSELFGPLLFAEEVLTTPLEYVDGALQLPDGPGLGVVPDPDAVRALRRTGLTRD